MCVFLNMYIREVRFKVKKGIIIVNVENELGIWLFILVYFYDIKN